MSDIIDDLARDISAPVEKTLTFNGRSDTVYFKPMTGGQKAQLMKGKRMAYKQGDAMSMDVDLELNERETHRVLAFCSCTADGKPRFKGPEEVAALPSPLIAALAKLAGEVNKGAGEEPGES